MSSPERYAQNSNESKAAEDDLREDVLNHSEWSRQQRLKDLEICSRVHLVKMQTDPKYRADAEAMSF